MSYLVIVESPAKCNKIAGYLNELKQGDIRVEASMGHIRTITGLKSVNIAKDFATTYSIITGKQQVITKLRKAMSGRHVILATDPDREGEAIAYHIADCLGIPTHKARRMTFNEITKSAVQKAWTSQRGLDMDLINAQRTRQILDLLVGYELSPILWIYVAPKLSAGRCQSPALRLIAEREAQITKALEGISADSKTIAIEGDFKFGAIELTAKADRDYPLRPESAYTTVIETAYKSHYIAKAGESQEVSRAPPAPFTTSTIQQEASRRFGLPPSSTMKILQKLYEEGRITYMRTDSTMIAPDAVQSIRELVVKKYGAEYSQSRAWGDKKSVSAQEAHECIRPTHIDDIPQVAVYSDDTEDDISQHHIGQSTGDIGQKVYAMVWCRSVASQMTSYREQQTHIRITTTTKGIPVFLATAMKTTHMGWKQVYGLKPVDTTRLLGVKEGSLTCIRAKETLSRIQGHYDEASLIRELERLGIGRPSTYSGIVETLGERGYVVKESRQGKLMEMREWEKCGGGKTTVETKPTQILNERNKMYLTDLGYQVNTFLVDKFKGIMDYKYTAHIEERLDRIAKGSDNWVDVARHLYEEFHPQVQQLKKERKSEPESKDLTKDTELGTHPVTKTVIYMATTPKAYRIYQQNPSREAWVTRVLGTNTPTLEEAVILLEYPKEIGDYQGKPVIIKHGRYGYYAEWNGKNIGLPKELQENPAQITLKHVITTHEQKESRIIKEFKGLSILNGPYGPYIRKGTANYSIPKEIDPSSLTLKQINEIISENKTKPKRKWTKTADDKH